MNFVDAQTGTAVGEKGVIVRTVDGGTTWTAQTSGTTEDLFAVFLLDAQTGWTSGTKSILLETTDGGALWNPAEDIAATAGTLKGIWFTSKDNGLAVGSPGTLWKFGPISEN